MPTYDHFQENTKRYQFFQKIVSGKVLDISYGKSLSFHASKILLDGNATEIWHHDISDPFTIQVRKKNEINNIEFNLLKNLIIEKNFFDFIISTESLQYQNGIFNSIDSIFDILKDDGKLIIIVTNKEVTALVNYRTSYDLPQKLFSLTEFVNILKTKFENIEIFSQRLINEKDLAEKNFFRFYKFKFSILKFLKNISLKIDKNQKFYTKFIQPQKKKSTQNSTMTSVSLELIPITNSHKPLFLIAICSKKLTNSS